MKFSNQPAKQSRSSIHTVMPIPSREKPAPQIVDRANEFDWSFGARKLGGSVGKRRRDGVNFVLSSALDSKFDDVKTTEKKYRITLSFSEDLLEKLRWRIGDNAIIGFSCRKHYVSYCAGGSALRR